MTARTHLAVPLVIAVLLAAATPAAAQTVNPFTFGLLVAEQSRPSFSIIGAGARAAGMGSAFTALADDASAASYNPAGLALLLLPEVSLVGNGRRSREEYTGFVPIVAATDSVYDDTATEFDTRNLNFAAFTLPFAVKQRNLCFQLSYHRLIDFTYSADRGFSQRTATSAFAAFRQSVEQDGDIHTLSLAAAYQLTQRLSLGLTLSRWDGEWRFATYDVARELGTARDAFLTYEQRNELEGWSWSAGALLRYRYLNVGAIYRLGFDADYTFSSTFDTNVPTTITEEPAFKTTLHWPASWTAGIAIKPFDTWHITADYARYNWSTMEFEGIASFSREPINFFDLQPSAVTTTRDVHQWRFGTEYTFFAGKVPLALRAGYFRDKQPGKLLEVAESASIDGYSGGFGIKLGQFSIDLAYQRRSWTAKVAQFVDPRVIEDGSLKRVAIGDKSTTEQSIYLALLYQFPSGEGVNRVLRWLFVAPEDDNSGDES